MRILLTEDEQELRSMLAEMLTNADHEVVEAESADAAAVLMRCPDGFDALVTDIHMPGRLDGLELGRLFRRRHARNPIVYMTGRPDAMCGVRLRPDCEAVLFKPYGLLALVATLQAMPERSMQDRGELWPRLEHALGLRKESGLARTLLRRVRPSDGHWTRTRDWN